MRTGMEAVYTLLNVDRGVPEVWGSTYDVRDLLNATVQLRDGKKITDMELAVHREDCAQGSAQEDSGHGHREVPEGIQCHLMRAIALARGLAPRLFAWGDVGKKTLGLCPKSGKLA